MVARLAASLIVGVVFWLCHGGRICPQTSVPAAAFKIEISFPESASSSPLDGHILLGISTNPSSEPRFQLREEEARSAQFFGLDVDDWEPGKPAVIDSTALGYPLKSLDQLP